MTMQLAPSTGIISLPLNTNFPNSNSSSNSPSLNNGLSFQNQPTLSSLISQCTHIKHLHQIHAQMLRSGIFFDPYSASKLFTTCALPPFSNIRYAHQIFDQIPQPNLYTWNILIRAYASSSDPVQSLVVFLQMLYHCQDFPNKFTFPFVFKAASELKASQTGKACHGMVIKSSLGSDLFILNSLIHFYSSCGDMDLAYRVFAKILNKDVVSWNSIINASARGDFPMDAFELFMEMEKSKLKPNGVTMVGLLSASAKKLDLEYGRWVCSYIKTNDIYMDLTLSNSMLDMHTKCGSVEDAEILFNEMPEKDIVSWTTMLDGYAKMGKYNEAKRIFNTMPKQDIAAWNVLISSYEQSGKPKEALATFHELQVSKIAKPDEVTLVSTLSACAQLGAIDLGGWIHVYIRKHGIQLNCHLVTSLIDMYAKCGDLDKALEVFYLAEKKDVFVWSSMIAGLGMHGRGKDAIDLFLQMQKAKVKPNAVTFTNVLCACSHAGLVNEARRFFYEMGPVHGIEPGSKHYACMVDVLGRAGFLKDAEEFIEKMPISPSASVWGALLGACRLHMNVELAEKASTHLLELEPRNHGAIVLLSNIYAKTGQWDKVSELRKLMRDSELKKEPGCSSIEVNGIVHEFLVSDNSHPRCREVYLKLDEIAGRLKLVGYKPNKSQVLQLVEEEDMKEHALNLHSEKLAIAFGLISIDRGQPIRVVKNLRVCGDCHEVAKLISSLYDREILIRDRYRFHHFRGGQCSCTDYW